MRKSKSESNLAGILGEKFDYMRKSKSESNSIRDIRGEV